MMNANDPQTPGVYTVEKNAFPNSVAEVPTAIPAFIGYTEKAEKNGKPIPNTPILVNSLTEYSTYFGGTPTNKFPVHSYTPTEGKAADQSMYDVKIYGKYYKVQPAVLGTRFYLYESLLLFYQNGGGPCYIVSVGAYETETIDADTENLTYHDTIVAKDDLLKGLQTLPSIQFPKPTMILIPDGLSLNQSDYYTVMEQVLMQCGALGDRVALIDIYQGDQPVESGVIETFRNNIGNHDLRYGIAYYPFLQTTILNANDVTYSNVDQSSTGAEQLSTIFPAEPALANLEQLNADSLSLRQVSIPPNFTAFNNTPTSMPTSGSNFATWQFAYNGMPINASSSSTEMLEWQGNVIYAMALTLTHLGKNNSLQSPQVSVSNPNLIKAISRLMVSTGSLSSLMIQMAAYDSHFKPSALGIFTQAHMTRLGTDAGLSIPAGQANPYPATATTADACFPIVNAFFQQTFNALMNAFNSIYPRAQSLMSQMNNSLEMSNPYYKQLMGSIAKEANILPPTPAMAGIYTMTDNTKGVWYAPANVNINSVTAPMVSIDNDAQAGLNVDALAGKSINAIRSFYGQGPAIVWGARTLDGNSQDWRYINVRRTMIMIEQSVKNAAFSLVFEPNDSGTWATCESMLTNFLNNLWGEGALQGASAADAFSVAVGLGKTMTPEDILNGIMRVQVKVAIVHPAEFIIITYEQQMAKA